MSRTGKPHHVHRDLGDEHPRDGVSLTPGIVVSRSAASRKGRSTSSACCCFEGRRRAPPLHRTDRATRRRRRTREGLPFHGAPSWRGRPCRVRPCTAVGMFAYPVGQHTPQVPVAPAPCGPAPFLRCTREGLDRYLLYVRPTRIGYDTPLHGFPPRRCSTWNIALNMAGSHPQALTDHHDVAACRV